MGWCYVWKQNLYLPYNPAITFPGIYTTEMNAYILQKVCI